MLINMLFLADWLSAMRNGLLSHSTCTHTHIVHTYIPVGIVSFSVSFIESVVATSAIEKN